MFLSSKTKRKELWPIFVYIIYSFASIAFLNQAIISISGRQFLAYRIVTIFELIFLSYYLSLILKANQAKKLLGFLTLIFIGTAIFDLTKSNSQTFDSIPTVLECLIIILFSVLFFYEQLKSTEAIFIYSNPNFLIVVGLILFFSGSFFVFIYAQNYWGSAEFTKTFQLLTAFLSLIENIFFLIAFIIAKKPVKTLKNQSNT
jgi:hypothetical protein